MWRSVFLYYFSFFFCQTPRFQKNFFFFSCAGLRWGWTHGRGRFSGVSCCFASGACAANKCPLATKAPEDRQVGVRQECTSRGTHYGSWSPAWRPGREFTAPDPESHLFTDRAKLFADVTKTRYCARVIFLYRQLLKYSLWKYVQENTQSNVTKKEDTRVRYLSTHFSRLAFRQLLRGGPLLTISFFK